MKKVHLLFGVLVISILLLVGCGGEFKKNMEFGEQALGQGDYPTAIGYFTKAISEKPNDQEVATKLVEAKNGYFAKLISEGKQLKEEKKYAESYEKFQEALKLYPTRKEEIKEDFEVVTIQKEKQEELNQYMVWVEPVVNDYTTMLTDWRTEITAFAVGTSNQKTLAEKLKVMLTDDTELMNKIEKNSVGVGGELKEYNKQFIEGSSDVNRGIFEMIALLNQKEVSNESVVQIGYELQDRIKVQTSYLLTVDEYIQMNDLVLLSKEELEKALLKKEKEEKTDK